MKKVLFLVVFLGSVFAADNMVLLNVDDVIESPLGKEHLLKNVVLSFGTGKGTVVSKGVVASRKTNAFGKDKNAACERAAVNSLRALQEAALKKGVYKVINIKSYYKKNELKNSKTFECAQGSLMVGVAFKGDIAK